MKPWLIFVFAVATLTSSAEDSKILGTWQSDRGATLDYIAENAKLPEAKLNLFEAMIGKSLITFRKGGVGTITTDAYEFRVGDGKPVQIPESTQKFTYEVLGETEDQIVTKVTFPESDDLGGLIEIVNRRPFSVLNFSDGDTYWVYTSDGLLDIHAREYFKRVNVEEREQGGARQPATAVDSKSESAEKVEPESDDRSQ